MCRNLSQDRPASSLLKNPKPWITLPNSTRSLMMSYILCHMAQSQKTSGIHLFVVKLDMILNFNLDGNRYTCSIDNALKKCCCCCFCSCTQPQPREIWFFFNFKKCKAYLSSCFLSFLLPCHYRNINILFFYEQLLNRPILS